MVLTRALIAFLASILPLPNGIFGRPMRACPPEWKWLFATLQRYNVKHKHNQGKRVANGIVCSKEGRNATSPLHSRGSPNKGGQNQKSKPPLGVTMMPLGAHSISKYGALVRPDAQIVAVRAHCACTALKAPPQCTPFYIVYCLNPALPALNAPHLTFLVRGKGVQTWNDGTGFAHRNVSLQRVHHWTVLCVKKPPPPQENAHACGV